MMIAQDKQNIESQKHGSADVQARQKDRDEIYGQIRRAENDLRNMKSNIKRINDESNCLSCRLSCILTCLLNSVCI